MAEKQPTLVLQPTIKELTHEQLEEHVELVRARRMVAALEYAAGMKAEHDYLVEKTQKQIRAQYESLGRELDTLDRAIDKVEARMARIEELKTTLGFEVDYG